MNTSLLAPTRSEDYVDRHRVAHHASSSRLVRASDELPAEDAHYWDRLLEGERKIANAELIHRWEAACCLG